MTEKERMLSGELYCPYKVNDSSYEKCQAALEIFNKTAVRDRKEGNRVLRSVLGHLEEDAVIVPPFYCEKGSQLHIGKHFYANTGLLILDVADVLIGDNVFIAPRVCIFTAGHPIDADIRNMELEYAKRVVIGSNVWIGGNVVINPGVTIGDNTVIGSGAVVTKDIPSGVIAAGNPCKVIRPISADDHRYWQKQLADYRNDSDIE